MGPWRNSKKDQSMNDGVRAGARSGGDGDRLGRGYEPYGGLRRSGRK